MASLRNLNVLLVENNEVNIPLYTARYSDFFRDNGYQSSITVVDCDEESVKRSMAEAVYHVVITDITFGNRDELGGIRLISSLKKKYPGVMLIGNSISDFGVSELVGVDIDLFVPKDAMMNGELVEEEWFGSEFRKKFRQNTELQIDQAELQDAYSKKSRSEVERLIRECLFTSHSYDESFDLASAKLHPLTRGYSDSRVFRVTTESKEGNFKHIQAVIKISYVNKAKLELKNFNRFVKWTLPFDWRVDVLGHSFGEKYGAVCYSFIDRDVGEGRFDDMERYILAGDFEKISYIISKIMDADSRKWYQSDIYSSIDSIQKYYRERYYSDYGSNFRKTQSVLERDARLIEDFYIENGALKSRELDFSALLPTESVLGKTDFPCQMCIGHGDLHARNILVSSQDNGKIVFIDFQQTGRCHVFEDFVILEHSIRMHYPDPDGATVSDLIGYEDLLNNCSGEKFPDKFELISCIRRRARAHFENEPWHNYVYGALTFGMRLLREEKIVDEARRSLIFSIISCSKYFEVSELNVDGHLSGS